MNRADEQKLVGEARRAYGLAEHEVMAARCTAGVVTLVTIGGHKATWRPGDKVKPLSDHQAGRARKPDVQAP